jgi:hypothetical protein
MRARPVVLLLCLASALGAYACSSTFPSTLPVYDPDGGPPLADDSGLTTDAAPADAQVVDSGDSGSTTDGGDSGAKEDSGDAGDSGAPHDAGDGGG